MSETEAHIEKRILKEGTGRETRITRDMINEAKRFSEKHGDPSEFLDWEDWLTETRHEILNDQFNKVAKILYDMVLPKWNMDCGECNFCGMKTFEDVGSTHTEECIVSRARKLFT